MASRVVNEECAMTQQELAEAVRCLWSFFAQGII